MIRHFTSRGLGRCECRTILLHVPGLPDLYEEDDTNKRDEGGQDVSQRRIDEVGDEKLCDGKRNSGH